MIEQNNSTPPPNEQDKPEYKEPKTYQEYIDAEFEVIGSLDKTFFEIQKLALKAATVIGCVGIALSYQSRSNVSNILAFAGALMLHHLADFREKRQKIESQISNFCAAHEQFFEKEIQSAPSSAEQKKLVHMADAILNPNIANNSKQMARNMHIVASGCLAGQYFFDSLTLGTFLIAEAFITTATNVFRHHEAKKQLTHIQKQLPLGIKIPNYDKQNT